MPVSPVEHAITGLRQMRISGPFGPAWERLLDQLRASQTPLFATVDHAANARAAGLDMPETRVAIFGNPRVGTGLMLTAPSCAVDLPLRMALRQEGDILILSWNEPSWLGARHHLPPETEALHKISAFLEQLARAVAGETA